MKDKTEKSIWECKCDKGEYYKTTEICNQCYESESNRSKVRYLLSEKWSDKSPLICIAMNPSSAIPKDLDRTVTRLRNYAFENRDEYGGWYMLNVCSKREADSNKVKFSKDIRNVEEINSILKTYEMADLLLAWGCKREKQFKERVAEIIHMIETSHKGKKMVCVIKEKPYHFSPLNRDLLITRKNDKDLIQIKQIKLNNL